MSPQPASLQISIKFRPHRRTGLHHRGDATATAADKFIRMTKERFAGADPDYAVVRMYAMQLYLVALHIVRSRDRFARFGAPDPLYQLLIVQIVQADTLGLFLAVVPGAERYIVATRSQIGFYEWLDYDIAGLEMPADGCVGQKQLIFPPLSIF